jgi:hypothetical protein
VNYFDELCKRILESLGPLGPTSGNVSGTGGALGTFQTSNWTDNPTGTPGTDEYNKGDYRRPVALGAKKKKGKTKIAIQKRPFVSM